MIRMIQVPNATENVIASTAMVTTLSSSPRGPFLAKTTPTGTRFSATTATSTNESIPEGTCVITNSGTSPATYR
jgi:hypothetical protein